MRISQSRETRILFSKSETHGQDLLFCSPIIARSNVDKTRYQTSIDGEKQEYGLRLI